MRSPSMQWFLADIIRSSLDRTFGPFIFYEVGGSGGIWGGGEGGMPIKMAFEGGGVSQTNIEGRIQVYYKLSFCFKMTFDDKKYL